jgi:hypothetical protein
MVENINLQKRVFPASSKLKIKALEQKQGGMQERHFKKHLDEEGDEDKKKEQRSKDKLETRVSKQTKKKKGFDNKQGLKTERSQTESPHLKVIDIVV